MRRRLTSRCHLPELQLSYRHAVDNHQISHYRGHRGGGDLALMFLYTLKTTCAGRRIAHVIGGNQSAAIRDAINANDVANVTAGSSKPLPGERSCEKRQSGQKGQIEAPRLVRADVEPEPGFPGHGRTIPERLGSPDSLRDDRTQPGEEASQGQQGRAGRQTGKDARREETCSLRETRANGSQAVAPEIARQGQGSVEPVQVGDATQERRQGRRSQSSGQRKVI